MVWGCLKIWNPNMCCRRHVYPFNWPFCACWSIPESPVLKGPCSAHIRLEIEYWTIQCMRATVSDLKELWFISFGSLSSFIFFYIWLLHVVMLLSFEWCWCVVELQGIGRCDRSSETEETWRLLDVASKDGQSHGDRHTAIASFSRQVTLSGQTT